MLGFSDDRGRALGRVLRADAGEHLLDLVLERGVDRQPERLAGHGRLHVVDRDRLPDRVADDLPNPVVAAEDAVVLVLEAAQALAPAADEPEHLRGRPGAGIDALDLRDQRDPVDPQVRPIAAAWSPGSRWAR